VTEPLPDGWAPNTDLFGAQWDALPVDVQGAALTQAVVLLWALTGRQLGTRRIKLAPYVPWPRQSNWPSHSGFGLSTVAGGVAFGPLSGLGCSAFTAFRLPGRPVEVLHVWVDDVELPDTAWVLDPDGTLVRTDGSTWRLAQNVYRPVWVVEYVEGAVVDAAGNAAAGRLALEIGKALVADPACRLNPRTRDIVRGSTSLTLADPTDVANAGLTGVPPVDRWIRAVNPKGQQEMALLSGMNTARHRVLA
jgi:hypothetical protein